MSLQITVGITTQMKWTTDDRAGPHWAIITGGSGGGAPCTTHPDHLGEHLWTIRVDETCPHHESINHRLNDGGNGGSWANFDEDRAHRHPVVSTETLFAIARYLMEDGRFGLSITVEQENHGETLLQTLSLPKSIGSHTIHEEADYDRNWDRIEGTERDINHLVVSYKVNGSTGERNETGEKRIARLIAALE